MSEVSKIAEVKRDIINLKTQRNKHIALFDQYAHSTFQPGRFTQEQLKERIEKQKLMVEEIATISLSILEKEIALIAIYPNIPSLIVK